MTHPGGSGIGRQRALEANTQPPAHSAKAPTSLELTCERRTVPAEPRRGTRAQRQPRHPTTPKQGRAPGCMRRSFRTLRLCAIPGVSPRAGMRCPVGVLRTPHLPRAFLRLHKAAAGSVGSGHWKPTANPPPHSAKAPPSLELTCERRTVPAELLEALVPSDSPATQPPKNMQDRPFLCK
jgi:hypothetical protein